MPRQTKLVQGVVSADIIMSWQRVNKLAASRRKAADAGTAGPLKLLTECEAASLLRCSLQKVKRLRLSGKLPYLRGRPAMIEEADLQAYVEWEKQRRLPAPLPTAGEETQLFREEARKRIQRYRLRRRVRDQL